MQEPTNYGITEAAAKYHQVLDRLTVPHSQQIKLNVRRNF
jgi:hypothetical protein